MTLVKRCRNQKGGVEQDPHGNAAVLLRASMDGSPWSDLNRQYGFEFHNRKRRDPRARAYLLKKTIHDSPWGSALLTRWCQGSSLAINQRNRTGSIMVTVTCCLSSSGSASKRWRTPFFRPEVVSPCAFSLTDPQFRGASILDPRSRVRAQLRTMLSRCGIGRRTERTVAGLSSLLSGSSWRKAAKKPGWGSSRLSLIRPRVTAEFRHPFG